MSDRPFSITSNGINRLGMVDARPSRPAVPLGPNTWAFTDLACAMNIGLEALESPAGRDLLIRLGRSLVHEWVMIGLRMPFTGDVDLMDVYVDHFLTRLREDFSNAFVSDIGSDDTLAAATRIAGWNGDLADYRPKQAVFIAFKYLRVADMTEASKSMWQGSSSRKLTDRHRTFLFIFALGTAHELVHAFVGFLAQGEVDDWNDTPENISFLDYGHQQPGSDPRSFNPLEGLQDTTPVSGESGRWFENELLGGSLEFYRDHDDDARQSGLPHVLDNHLVARIISPNTISELVREPRRKASTMS